VAVTPFNGRTRLVVEIVSLLIAVTLAFGGGAMWASGISHDVELHVADTAIHEGEVVKNTRIDDRVRLHLAPIRTELGHIHEALQRIEANQKNGQ